MVAPEDPVATGRQYGGRYQIKRSIASGGMAEVFVARDALLNRPVALKLMHPEFAGNKSFVERFRREAQAAASLNDPRIVSIYDWGSDDGTYFIVMEYVEGKTLAEIIRSSGPLEIVSAVRIAADVCGGLHLAHKKGIIHRDVKPANIALTATGQTKVMDFGIARAASDGAQVTQTGMIIGTAGYFSPEQAQGKPVDARSDVYSVGVVLYEMLTGTVPFKGESPVAVAYKHVTEDPVPPRDLAGDLSPDLEAVVMKALAKNPDNRYQTADEMRLDLERILRGDQVEATPLLSSQEQTAIFEAAYTSRGARGPQYEVDRTSVLPAPGARRGGGTGWLLAAVLLLGLAAGAYYVFQSLTPDPANDRAVPDVVGKPIDEATRLIGQAGLNSEVVRQQFSATLPVGVVISQEPQEGTKVTRGGEVKVQLVVSQGAEQAEVPNLAGLTRQEAEKRLIDAGFAPGDVSTQPDDAVEAGKVVTQTPGAASKADKGRQVALVLSSGKALISVPKVTEVDQQTAESRITEAALTPQVARACNASFDDGQVVTQEPAAGGRVKEGATVTFGVNQVLTLPDVRGLTDVQARTVLAQAGFENVEVQQALLGLSNVVSTQSPAGPGRGCPQDVIRLTLG